MTLKAFFSIFKGLSTKQIAILFGRCEFDFRTVFLFVITKKFWFYEADLVVPSIFLMLKYVQDI